MNSQRCPRSCRANQVPALLLDPSPTISSNASVALTLCRPRPESLLCFDSCAALSHIEVVTCSSASFFLYTAAVDRHANQHEPLPQLLQCQNDPTSPTIKLQRCTCKLIPYAIYTSQFYPVSGDNDCTPFDLSKTHACAAWILRSLLHYRKRHLKKQSPQMRRGAKLQCTKDRNSSVPARQCPEFNNTNRVDGHTSIGAPASILSSCCFNSASCSCCDWSIRFVATVWNTKAIALTRLYGLFRLSMASEINSFASSGVASTSVAVAPASLSRTISFNVSRTI